MGLVSEEKKVVKFANKEGRRKKETNKFDILVRKFPLFFSGSFNRVIVNFFSFIASLKRQYHGSRGIISQMVRNIAILQDLECVSSKISHPDCIRFANRVLHGSQPVATSIPDGIEMIGNSIAQPKHTIPIPMEIVQWFEQNNVKFWARMKKDNKTFHSLVYNRIGNSGSFFVEIKNRDEIWFGNILQFVSTRSTSYALVRLYQTLPNLLFHDIEFSNENIKILVEQNILGSGFIHLRLSNEIVLLKCKKIVRRIIFVPTGHNTGYASRELSSYQHD